MAEPMNMNGVLGGKGGSILGIFAVFVVVQAIFAAIYYFLHRVDHRHFTFNAEVHQGQKEAALKANQQALAALQARIETVRRAISELDRGIELLTQQFGGVILYLTSGPGFIARARRKRWFHVNAESTESVFGDPKESASQAFPNEAERLAARDKWRAWLPKVLERFEAEKKRLDERTLRHMTSPDIWSYWDFLYFSTIIQTTVGLGDILPNSTPVRLIVAAHVLIGYVILVVVLNIVLSQS